MSRVWFVEVGMMTLTGIAWPNIKFPSKAEAEREYNKRIERENVVSVRMYWKEGRKVFPFKSWGRKNAG
jgi:hypothetical protein